MTNPIYESQTRPSAMPLELRRGPAPGAIVGDAVADFGKTMLDAELRDRQRDRASAAADRSVAFAQMQADIDGELQQLKLDTPADGSGYEEKANAIVERRTSTFVDTLADPQIRNAFLPDVARLRANSLTSASAYAIERRGTKLVTDEETATATLANNLGRAPSDANWELYQQLTDKRIEQYGGMLPAAAIDELRRKSMATGAIAYAEGLAPEARKTLIDSGKLDSFVSAEKMLALRSGTEVDLRRAAAEQRALASQAKAETREQLATIEATLDAGTGKPQEWDALAERYAAIGDTSKAVTLRAKGASAAAAIQYRGLTVPQLDAKLAELNVLEAKNGGLSTAENSLRTGLQDVRKTVSSLLGQSPLLAASYSAGAAAPAPINWSDPATIEARRTSARAAARRYGQIDVKPLMPDEIEQMQAIYRAEGGKQAVLDRVRLFGDDAGSAARQVTNDPSFIHLADLSAGGLAGRSAAADAIAGEQVLKTNATIWPAGVKADAQTAWQKIAPMFATAPGLGNAIYQNAKSIYAIESVRAGDLDQTGLNEERWRGALDRAAGGDGRGRGGIVGINGSSTIVPEDMNKDDFVKLLARAPADAWPKAAQGRNAYIGGRKATLGEIRGAVPVPMAGGRYAFRIGNGVVTNSQHQPWTIDIAILRGDR